MHSKFGKYPKGVTVKLFLIIRSRLFTNVFNSDGVWGGGGSDCFHNPHEALLVETKSKVDHM